MTGSILQKASVVASLVSAVLAADVAQLEAAMRSAEQAGLESLTEYSEARAMVVYSRRREVGTVRCLRSSGVRCERSNREA